MRTRPLLLLIALIIVLVGCAGHAPPARPPTPAPFVAATTKEVDPPIPNDGATTVRAAGHGVTITALEVSRDRRWVATGDQHGVVKLWQAEPLREIATFLVPGEVASLALSNDAAIVTLTKEGRVTRWKGGSQAEVVPRGGRAIVLAADGALAIVTDRLVVRTSDGKEHTSDALPLALNVIAGARFDDEGGLTIIGKTGSTLHAVDVRGAITLGAVAIAARTGYGQGARLSANARTAAAWTDSHSIETWTLGQKPTTHVLAGSRLLDQLAISDDGRTVLVGPAMGPRQHDAILIDVATGEQTVLANLEVQKAWLDDARILATVDASLVSIDRRSGKRFEPPRSGPVGALAITPDGRRLVVGGAHVHAWALDGTMNVLRFEREQDARSGMSLSPDGELLLRSDRRHPITLERVSTGMSLHHVALPSGRAATFLGDGSFAAEDAGQIALFQPEKKLQTLPRGTLPSIDVLAARSDDHMLATGTASETPADRPILALRPLDDGPERVLLHGPGATHAIAFRPGSNLLASGHLDGTVRFWDVTASVASVAMSAPVQALAFRHDGKVLAAGLRDGTTRVIDVDTRAVVFTTAPVPSWTAAVAFLPDGRLASGHEDGGVRIWSLTGALVAELATIQDRDWLVLGRDGRFESGSPRTEQDRVYGVRDGALVTSSEWATSRRRRGVLGRLLHDRAPPPEAPATIVQGWPEDDFTSLVFDASGTMLAAEQRERTLLFDVGTGMLTARLEAVAPSFAPDGTTIAAYARGLTLFSRTGERLAATRSDYGLTPVPVTWRDASTLVFRNELPVSNTFARGGSVIVGAAASTRYLHPHDTRHIGSLQLWDAATVKPRPELPCSTREIVAVAAAASGKHVACADQSGLVALLDVATGARERWWPNIYDRWRGSRPDILMIAIHPTRRVMAAATSEGVVVRDFDGSPSRKLGTRKRADVVAFSPDGSLLVVGDRGELDVWDTSGWQSVRSIHSRTTPIRALAIDPRAPRILVATKDGPATDHEVLWDARDGSTNRRALRSAMSAASFAPDRDALVIARTNALDATEGDARTAVWHAEDRQRIINYLVHAGDVLVAVQNENDVLQTHLVGRDARTGAPRWETPLRRHTILDLALSPGGKRVAVASGGGETSRVTVVAASNGAEVTTFDIDPPPRSIAFVTEDVIVMETHDHVVAFDIASKRQLALLSGFHGAIAIASSPQQKLLAVGDNAGQVTLFDTTTWKERAHADLHAHVPESLAFLGDGRTLLWRDADGTGRFFDPASGNIATFAALTTGGLVVVDDTGPYLAPRDAAGALGFRWGDRTYPLEQFDALYNDPGATLERLGYASKETLTAYAAARRVRLERMKVAPDRGQSVARGAVPSLTVTGVKPTASTKRIALHVTAVDATRKLRRAHVVDNGVPVFGADGAPLAWTSRAEADIEVELVSGVNKLQTYVENEDGVLSLEATFVTTYLGAAPKPALRVYAFGVADYARQELDGLRYPAKDAHDFASLFKASPSFADVRVTELTDAKATRAAILGIRGELAKTTPEDMVILYVSGHGALDRSGSYYFAPHDADVADLPRSAISYASIEGLLDGIPARKKLLVMDSCHAGELDPAEAAEIAKFGRLKVTRLPAAAARVRTQTRDLFADLRRGTGAHVLASSAGAEYSFEDPSFQNSVFTYALLQGIRERKADAEGDGELRVSELEAFVAKKVAELTDGHQTPSARRDNLDADFDVTPDAPRKQVRGAAGCVADASSPTMFRCGVLELFLRDTLLKAENARKIVVDQIEGERAPGARVRWEATRDAQSSLRFVETDAAGESIRGGVVAVSMNEDNYPRTVRCTVVDAIPEALSRCERAIAALDGKPIFAVLPP